MAGQRDKELLSARSDLEAQVEILTPIDEAFIKPASAVEVDLADQQTCAGQR